MRLSNDDLAGRWAAAFRTEGPSALAGRLHELDRRPLLKAIFERLCAHDDSLLAARRDDRYGASDAGRNHDPLFEKPQLRRG